VPTPSILGSTVVRERSRIPSVRRSPFERLALEHCERIVTSGSCRKLIVQLELRFEGTCPITHEKTVLRVSDELLSNSMEHGFYNRQRAHVFVHVVSRETVGVEVSVSDDGWGFASGPIIDGNGFHLLRQIGDLWLGAAAGPFVGKTTITVAIPLQRCGVSQRCHATASPGLTRSRR
jgi:glucose-6-phosphate-specific signal transduction histidine kinase